MGIANESMERFQQKLESRQRKLSPFNVLVVDDEPNILELLQTALTTLEKHDVTTACSAASAMEAIENAPKPFDCLLLDIQMPDQSGIELLREIRKLSDYADTPVIMLTAMCEREYVDSAFMEGATDYLTKPFDFFELRSRMHAAQILLKERRKAKRTEDSVKALEEELTLNGQQSFEDPFTVTDVERLLGFFEFDNYIAQLSHGRLFNSQCVAMQLQDAAFIHDASARGDFRHTIADLARSISSAIAGKDCIFSYRGSGVFLIVEHGRKPVDTFLNESSLNRMFISAVGSRTASRSTRALVGEAVSMRSLSKARAFTALKTAVERLERRHQGVVDGSETHLPDAIGQEQRKLVRQRMYEKVLIEMFREESYLGKR